ncbi:unnamed protein product [Ambrosiozyma monospora]|uniref:Unnamed protein product n=1 Tax=Ambrosiozyma monospora TaxID=43982 RepID=A0ACB5SX31_AMBMO|nr:unnamed protein product [Ambrosiozyma monospora]
MVSSSFKLATFLFLAITSQAALTRTIPQEQQKNELEQAINNATPPAPLSDDAIINSTLHSLYAIGNNTELTKCEKCTTRLTLGKSLALTRPDLIPQIWSEWCIGEGKTSASTCKSTYNRNTVVSSNTGTNFANMLTLMDVTSLDAEYYCYYKESGACALPETPDFDISHLWPEKPEKAYVAPEPSNETFNVLHISDFHIELDYTVGAEANCSLSMCCTPHSQNKLDVPEGYNFEEALGLNDDEVSGLNYYDLQQGDDGKWTKGEWIGANKSVWEPAYAFGHYECDAPEILINSSLHSIADFQSANNLTFDFSIFTGDLVDHDELKYTGYQMTVDSEEIVFRDIKQKLQDIPVYAVMGNHDTFPYGEIASEKSGFSNMFDWNAELMAEMWYDFEWLDAEEAQLVRTHYTGFSVTTKRGLKVISLNSNCWYMKNHYLYANMTRDPDQFGQFEFLIDELVESEANDQRVWIIWHIPVSTSETLPIPAKIWTDIIERFSPYTIAAMFNGHTHRDEFSLF